MLRQQEDKSLLQQHLGNEYNNHIVNRHQTEQMNVILFIWKKAKDKIERKTIGTRKKNDRRDQEKNGGS